MECSEIHLFSCCLPASWQLDRVLCLPFLRAWTSGPVYKNWSQSSDWEIQNTPIFRIWGAWSCSWAPLVSPVSSCCIDPAQGWRTEDLFFPSLHSPTGAAHSCITSVSFSSSFWIAPSTMCSCPSEAQPKAHAEGECGAGKRWAGGSLFHWARGPSPLEVECPLALPSLCGFETFFCGWRVWKCRSSCLGGRQNSVCFWDSLGEKNVAEVFLYSEHKRVLWSREKPLVISTISL